jgi:hypothetical protein
LIFYYFENTNSHKNKCNQNECNTQTSFYLIPKDNQLFSYTKFPVKKINVEQILKLCQNHCLIIPPNNILKSINSRVLQVLLAIRGAQLEGLLDGSMPVPPPEIVEKDANNKDVKKANPEYARWVAQDQAVLSYLPPPSRATHWRALVRSRPQRRYGAPWQRRSRPR